MNIITALLLRIVNLKTLSSFRIPAYRIYFMGMIGIWSSFAMEQVARMYLVYEITGSAMALGTITLAGTAPILLLSLFGGAVADRFSKKMLIIVSQIGFTLLFLSYGITVMIGYLTPEHPESWWVLLVGGIVMGTLVALTMPSRGAMIPEIVDRDRLMNAISLNILGMSFFQMICPVIAGYIIGVFGYTTVFMVMVVLNCIALVFNILLPKFTPKEGMSKNVLHDIQDGFRYVAANRTIMLILIFFITGVLLVNPLQTLLPVFAKDILSVGVEGQGTLLSVMGIGSIVVSFLFASFPPKRRGMTLLISNIVMGVTIVLFAFSSLWVLSLVVMAMIGIGRIGSDATGNALMQAYTEPRILGRVTSIVMLSFGLGGLGSFFIGILAETISAPWALGGPAILLILASIYAIFFVPRLSKLA